MKVAQAIVGVAGAESTIAREFCRLLPEDVVPWCDRLNDFDPVDIGTIDRFLICTGYLAGQTLGEISDEDAALTWRRNFVEPARFCDLVFAANPRARVCLIGSESGFRGSHDMSYAGAKAALHLYVETKRLEQPGQQLICIAPHVIWDSRMTQSRPDLAALSARGAASRHGRWVEASEVAAQAYQALFIASPFLSKTIIRLGAEGA